LKIFRGLPRPAYRFNFSIETELRNGIVDFSRMERAKDSMVAAIVRSKMSIRQRHQIFEVTLASFD